MISFEQKFLLIDKFLSFFSKNSSTKGYILFTLHSLWAIIAYAYIILGPIGLKYLFAIITLIIQVFVNAQDRGCILLKSERKYLGRDWYGFYHILGYIFGEITPKIVMYTFITISITMFAIIVARISNFLELNPEDILAL